jgi:hypothetical protein
MIGFDLPNNFIENLEALIRKTRAKLKSTPDPQPEDTRLRRSLTPEFEAMANKSLCEFSAPTTANIDTGPTTDVGDNGFELKPALINMVQASQFCGKAHEDASAHHQHFLEICSIFTIRGIARNAILLHLFPFLLLGRAKQWFYANKDKNTTWDICSTAFLAKLFPVGRRMLCEGRLQVFSNSLMNLYILECPHHGMENWLLMQTFYHGLNTSTREKMDAAAGGAFLSLTIEQATTLVEKMASNQS